MKKRKLVFDNFDHEMFYNSIHESASYQCTICSRLGYSKSVQSHTISKKQKSIFDELKISIDSKFMACHTCIATLKKNKLPSYCKFNKMEPGTTPDELNILNELETRILLRIRPFMKLYK